MKSLYIFLFAFIVIIGIVLIRDYQARMIIVNANYQCIYGDKYACEFLTQEPIKEVK